MICLRLGLFLLVVLAFGTRGVSGAGTPEFPPGEVRVLTDGATSGILKMRLENLDLSAKPGHTPRAVTWLLAGAADALPTATLTAGHFYKMRGEELVGERYTVPAATESTGQAPQFVRVTPSGRLRDFQAYSLTFFPAVAIGSAFGQPETWVVDWVEIDIDLGKGERRKAKGERGEGVGTWHRRPADVLGGLGEREDRNVESESHLAHRRDADATISDVEGRFGGAGEFVSAQVINPQIDSGYRVPVAGDWSAPARWAERVNSAGEVFRFRVYEPGVYRLGAGDIGTTAPVSGWKLLNRGEEIPLLEHGDGVLFHVAPFDRGAVGEQVLWLVAEERGTSGPLRIGRETAARNSELRILNSELAEESNSNTRTRTAARNSELRILNSELARESDPITITRTRTRTNYSGAGGSVLPAPSNSEFRIENSELSFTESAAGRGADLLISAAEDVTTAGSSALPAPSNSEFRIQNSELLATSSALLASFSVTAEELGDYHAKVRPTAETTRWYWKAIADGEIGGFDLNLPMFAERETTEPVELQMFYSMQLPPPAMPSLELIVNGAGDEVVTATQAQGSVTYKVSANRLRTGVNQLGLKVQYPPDPGDTQDVLVHKIVARWQQPLLAKETQATTYAFTVVQGGAGAGSGHSTGDASTGGGRSDAAKMVWRLPDGRGTTAKVFWSLADALGVASLETGVPRGGAPAIGAVATGVSGTYQLVAPGEALRVSPIERVAGLRLFDSEYSADYLAITDRGFIDALMPLLRRRQEQGLATAVIDIQTIFDHFSYGERSYDALKSFLQYTLAHWGPRAPEYVLLCGEASDYRGDPKKLPRGGQRDIIPVPNGLRKDGIRGDHFYTTIAGSDSFSDVALGRLSVKNADELTSAIAKIIRYEEEAAGEWLFSTQFVFDDNDEFPKVVDEVIDRAGTPATAFDRLPQADYTYVPNAKVYGRRRSYDATREVLRMINSGVGMLNYFGHGGPNLWSHERLLHLQDMAQITNAPRLAFISCASCDNAWLDYPMPPVNTSMGELLVKKPNGGAIGLLGPVSGASPFEHQTLIARLVEGVYKKNLRRLGMVTTYAKNLYLAETSSPSIPDQYILVGDPAARLNIPVPEGHLAAEPAAIASGERTRLRVRLESEKEDFEGGAGTLYMRRMDRTGEQVIAQPVHVNAAGQMFALNLPPLKAGTYGLSLSWRNGRRGHVSIGRLDVADPKLVVLSGDGAKSDKIVMTNPTPLHLDNAQLGLSLSGAGEKMVTGRAMQTALELAPHQRLSINLPWTAIGAEWATVAYRAATGGEWKQEEVPAPLSKSSRTFAVISRDLRIRTSPVRPVSTEQPTFHVELENVGTTRIVTASAVISEEGAPLTESVTIQDLEPGGKRVVTLPAKQPLAAGEHRLHFYTWMRDTEGTGTQRRVLYDFEDRVRVGEGVNLRFVPGSVRAEPGSMGWRSRVSVFVRGKLENTGDADVDNVGLNLMIGGADGSEAQTLNDATMVTVEKVPARSTVDVLFRWENNMGPGEQHLWLVANRGKTIKETSYDDNGAEVQPFKLDLLGNFHVGEFTVRPPAARVGEPVRFVFATTNDQNTSRGPVDIEYGFKNPLTSGLRNSASDVVASRKLIAKEIPANGQLRQIGVMPLPEGATQAFVTVNANKELEEVDPGDNTTQTQVVQIVDLPTSASWDLSKFFPHFAAQNVELLPGNTLRLMTRISAAASPTPITADLADSESISGELRERGRHDGKWSIAPFLLQVGAGENPEPVTLKLPVRKALPGLNHDVYLHTRVDVANTASRFKVAVEGGEWLAREAASGPIGKPQRIHLGRFDAGDDSIDVRIDNVENSPLTIVMYEVIPVHGIADSPAFAMPEGTTGTVMLKFADTRESGGEHRYMVRTGTRAKDGIAWSDWQDAATGVAAAPFVQVRVEMRPSANEKPMVSGAVMEVR